MEKKFKLPHTLYLSLFLFVLCLICAGLLSIVNALTKDAIDENNRIAEEKANESIANSFTELGFSNVTRTTNNYVSLYSDSKGSIVQVFEGTAGTTKGYAFKVEITNKFTTLHTLVVIEEEGSNRTIKHVEVLDEATTLGSSVNSKFYNANGFNVVGDDINSYTTDFEIISGATYSSRSVKDSISYAINMLKQIKGEQ